MINCHNRTGRDKDIKFYVVPSIIKNQGEKAEELSIERRTRWLSAISRDKLSESVLRHDRVCSRHFVSGKPAASWDKYNVDWVPTLNLGHSKKQRDDERQLRDTERAERGKLRRKRQHEETLQASAAKILKLDEPGEQVKDIFANSSLNENVEDVASHFETLSVADVEANKNETVKCDQAESSTQTDEFEYLFSSKCSCKAPFDADDMTDDEKVRFYTGLTEAKTLQLVFEHVSPFVTRKSKSLSKFQEMVMSLMKNRINVPYQDLSYRFGVSVSTVYRIYTTWMEVMDARLSPLIYWPERHELWHTMPKCFQSAFGNRTTVIIDCFEIFIERPTNLLARAQTFSSYKHHNTIKLLPGDMVMADRGFTVEESVAFKRAELVIPAFTKGKTQLDPIDVEKTREIAHVRIHVERVIGLLRRKYTILEGILPTDFLSTSSKDQSPLIDQILRVSAALTNLCPPIVPFD
ncbi:hypothetical protein AWC38_SpisGene21009 [Stylophora pistillata]|uniref:THAP-type domain-containing protein n=1 Tax=Stylophora pistillata TaxID=50429 RepID=A0A2B4REN4_STYPI|nr:hypothetical protein AWC38_SpisGene21009 [Stylophora pistillata]